MITENKKEKRKISIIKLFKIIGVTKQGTITPPIEPEIVFPGLILGKIFYPLTKFPTK